MHPPVVGDVRLLHEDPDVSKNRSLWLRQFSAAAVVAEVGFEAVSFSRRVALLLAPAEHLVMPAPPSAEPVAERLADAGLDARVLAVPPDAVGPGEVVRNGLDLVYLHDSGTDPAPAELLDRWMPTVRDGGILAGRDLLVDRAEGLVLAVEDLVASGRAQMHSVALAPTADWAVKVQRS